MSSSAVPTSAHGEVRLPGTASAFQIPPSPARLPTVARPGSARAAKAATPAGSEPCAPAPDRTVATSHGADATRASAAAVSSRGVRAPTPPGSASSTRATVVARIAPVGVRPAAASVRPSGHQARGDHGAADRRRRSAASTVHGSAAYPVSRLQCPCSSRSAT